MQQEMGGRAQACMHAQESLNRRGCVAMRRSTLASTRDRQDMCLQGAEPKRALQDVLRFRGMFGAQGLAFKVEG
jgi:hypothetical protein